MEAHDHERETTEEASDRSQLLPAADIAEKAKSADDFLALGRFGLTEADIHSRANVRHLMARSDQLDKALLELAELRERNATLNKELAVLKERYSTRGGLQAFITFCVSVGFAALGSGISLITANPPSMREGIIAALFGALIAIGAVIAQVWSRY